MIKFRTTPNRGGSRASWRLLRLQCSRRQTPPVGMPNGIRSTMFVCDGRCLRNEGYAAALAFLEVVR
jgi:hypothetical protein